jgi:hypothetical protein
MTDDKVITRPIEYLLWYYGEKSVTFEAECARAITRFIEKYDNEPTLIWFRVGEDISELVIPERLEIRFSKNVPKGLYFELSVNGKDKCCDGQGS